MAGQRFISLAFPCYIYRCTTLLKRSKFQKSEFLEIMLVGYTGVSMKPRFCDRIPPVVTS